MLEAGHGLESSKNKPQSSTDLLSYDEALENFYGNWLWRCVHAMLDHQDFDSSPIWLSRKLNVSVEDVVEALEGLKVLSLVEQTSNGYKARMVQFLTPTDKSTPEYQLNCHKMISQQIINKMDLSKKLTGRVYFAASNKEEIDLLTNKIRAAIDEFDKRSQTSIKDGLYGLTFSSVDLLGSDNNGGAE